MAKKQLKKINQPKKYLQGGSNMGSVSMMRQNPYYVGQVNQNAAEEDLANSQEQLMQAKQTAVQNKRNARDVQNQQLDETFRNSATNLMQSAATDKKEGRLGKLFSRAPLSGQAAMNISAGTQIAPMYAAPATTTAASNIGSLIPGAAEVGANLANTSTNVVSGVSAATAGVPAAVAPTGEFVTQGIAAGAKGAAGLSNLATAGIGAAATIGGQVIKKRSNDNSDYTFTDKERRGNTAGSMLASAGTGFGIGNMLLPGVGGAIGAGIGAGIGALKAHKENKAAEEEAQRLQREQAAMRGAYQSAFVNSRLTGADTGFGLNSSTNMNNKFTNEYQVAKTGGVTGIQEDRRTKKVPGGKIVPIEGTDAVEFIGRTHKDGGIIIEKDSNGKPIVEVEHKEVETPIVMNNNKKQDYIFSEYLKLGGKSFAQRSKEILKGGGSQQDLQQLAAMQEKAAGRNPQQIAQYGGIHKYATGGALEKNCPEGTFFNAYTGTCEPFNFSSMTNMISKKEEPNAATNTPATNSESWKNSAAELIRKKEGFSTKAKWDENAYRAGYGTDKILRDGKLIPVTKGMVVTKEEAENTLLNYSVGNYSQRIVKDLGQENWDKLNDDQRTALFSLGYNAGSAFISTYGYGRKIKANIEKGDFQAAADVIRNEGPTHGRRSGYIPSLKKRRIEEANLFSGKANNTSNQTSTQPAKKALLPPPPVSADVVPPTLAQRNSLPGVASMQMNEDIQMPEQPKSNIVSDPTDTRQERLEKEKPAGYTIDNGNKRPDGIHLTYNKDTKIYTYRDGKGLEVISGKNLNRLQNQMDALQPGATGFDTQLAEMEAPVQRQDLTGVKPNIAANTPTNSQTAADAQTVIAQQNGTTNAPAKTPASAAYSSPTGVKPATNGNPPAISDAEKKQAMDQLAALDADWAAGKFSKEEYNAKRIELFNSPAFNAAIDDRDSGSNPVPYNSSAANTQPVAPTQPASSTPPPPAAAATNGGPGTNNPTTPTINNQDTKFQHTAQGAGYLDYSDPNVAGGIWSGDRYNKEWKPLVASTMADPAKADQVINYLTNYTGADAADVKAKLKGKSREQQIAAISDLATDTKVGPFHNAVYGAIQSTGTTPVTPPATTPGTPPVVPPTTTGTPPPTTKRYTPCPPGTYLSTDGTCKQTPEYSKPYNGNIVAGIGAAAQLIPPIYAALKPYQKVGPIPGAPSVKGALLGRENMNQERTTSREMNTAINQEVTNNNTGAAGFAIRQAAMSAANKQMLDIANAESKANTDLRGKEAVIGMEASKFNAENSMKGQMFNADLAQKQNQYVDERNIGVVDAAANRLAGMANTFNEYKANDHLARVTNANTHSLERDKMYESLLKDSQKQNSQFYGASDAELRRIAAGLVEEQMGGVGRTGGVRQYISRLGELKSARATKAKL